MRLVRAAAAAVILASASAATAPALAGEKPVYQSFFGTAIDGTDPVAYFTDSRPVPGDPDIAHDWNGATWQFSSEENRALFAADPERYAPQYGGYCAYAVAQGSTASTVPEAWQIVDDKLYLNYDMRVQALWQKDIPGHVAAADRNWPGVLD